MKLEQRWKWYFKEYVNMTEFATQIKLWQEPMLTCYIFVIKPEFALLFGFINSCFPKHIGQN